MKSLIVLTALTGLLAVGCHSNRGGAYDQQEQNSGYYNNGTSENPNLNTPPNSSGGPERGPGTGGMGGTSTSPGNSSSGTSDSNTAPSNNQNQSDLDKDNNNNSDNSNDNNSAPSSPDNGNQAPK